MRNIVCPRCQQSVQAPDDLEAAHCVRCGVEIGSINTQITAAPTALAPQAIQPIDQFERDGHAAPRGFTDWDEFRTTSPAVQRELLELARRPMPDLRNVYLRPLPAEMPAGTEGWKRPLGTIEGAGDDFLFFWFVGCSMLFIGSIGIVGTMVAVATFLTRGRLNDPETVIPMVVTLAVFGWAVWYLFVRRRRLPYTMWVFEEGISWQKGWRKRGSAAWKGINHFLVGFNAATRMPFYWRATADYSWVLVEVDRAPALIPLLEYMEIRLTASQLLPRLEQIYAGQRVNFGAVQLDCNGLASGRFFAPWSHVRRVVRDRDHLFVDLRNRTEWVPIPYGRVSFPLVVMAIAHIMIAQESAPDSTQGDMHA